MSIATATVRGPEIEPQTNTIFRTYTNVDVIGILLTPKGIKVQYENGQSVTFVPTTGETE